MTPLERIKPFLSRSQHKTLAYFAIHGEEKQWFIDSINKIDALVHTVIPYLYEQDGMGDNAIVSLHYFHGGSDWYITEIDADQRLAFGFVILNGDTECAELGYISIDELVSVGIEMDLHFDPVTLGEIKKQKDVRR